MTPALPGDWDDLIIIAGGEYWGDVWGTHRHLAEAISRTRPVLYVDTPVSPLTRFRRETTSDAGLRLVHRNLALLGVSALPGLTRPGIRWTTDVLTRRAIRRALVRLGSPAVSALVVAGLDDLLGACPAAVRVLFLTDDFVAGGELFPTTADRNAAIERKLAADADVVVVVSEQLADRWRSDHGGDPVVVRNGCDPSAYERVDDAPLPADVELPSPIVGLVGRITHRLDLDVLDAIADTGCSVLIVGPRDADVQPERVDRFIARPNVQYVGRKPFGDLPSYLRVIDVGITPYVDSAFNRASFPLKTLEYLAAGRASVCTDLPAARSLGTDEIVLVRGPEEFSAAVTAELARPRTPEVEAARRAVARAHSWDARADEFLTAVDAASPRRVRPSRTTTPEEARPR